MSKPLSDAQKVARAADNARRNALFEKYKLHRNRNDDDEEKEKEYARARVWLAREHNPLLDGCK